MPYPAESDVISVKLILHNVDKLASAFGLVPLIFVVRGTQHG